MESESSNHTTNVKEKVIDYYPLSADTLTIIAKADSGASSHYFKPTDKAALTDLKITPFGPSVTLPDSTTLTASHSGLLPFQQNLSTKAKTAHVLDGLTNSSLISIGQLCDDDCIAVLDKRKLQVFKNSERVLEGTRNPTDGLWDIAIPLPSSSKTPTKSASWKQVPRQQLNAIIRKDLSKTELVQYLYGCCGSPVISTWKKAIRNGNFITWPGIDTLAIDTHLPKSIDSAKGHLNQERTNLQSTRDPAPTITTTNVDTDEDFFPLSNAPNEKTFECCAVIVPFVTKNTAYHDLTGRFPHRSSRGNEYLLIVYDYDSNSILHCALKNKTGAEIKRGWTIINDKLASGGNQPKLYILDNEASADLKKGLNKHGIAYQLVPPHVHRRNAAERAIQTFKNHLLAFLATCDPDFPVSEWDRLLFQAELTLNLLRNSRVNPRLSAYAYLFGNFDFNKTPLAPPGTRTIVHLKPDQRASWAFHGEEGWYVGPSMEHYRCVKCYLPTTARVRDVDTLQFFPKKIPFPKITTEDYLKQAASDILAILQKPPSSLPYLAYGDATNNAIVQIATLLGRADAPPELPTSAHPPRVQVPAHPPRVHIPLQLHPPRVPISIHPPRVPIPATIPTVLSPPTVPISKFLPPKQPAALPRVPALPHHTPAARLQQRNALHKNVPREQSLQHAQALHTFQYRANHIYTEEGKKETIDTLLNGTNGPTWNNSLCNEYGRLAQGFGANQILGTDTIDFIHKHEVPHDKKVTYGNFICDYRPLKTEKYRVRLTVGGDKLPYDDDAGSPAASLLETKLILNSTISDAAAGARFLTADLKDHFLASPMKDPEFMRIKYKYFPQAVRDQYNLDNLVSPDGYIYIRIKKGMYGLKQASLLAYKHLVNQLAPYGYRPCPYTTGLWEHTTRRTKFCLCVDDFGVKYFSTADAEHLLTSLRNHYKISVDWAGTDYCGLSIKWNYAKRYVDISMPGYIKSTLDRLQHPTPSRPQHAPHLWTQPAYGQKLQLAPIDETPKLDKTGTHFIQSCVGSLLYYARAVDGCMLTAINEISGSQASPTQKTMSAATMLLDYAATYPLAIIRYHASDMILHVDTDAAYLVLPNARSRYAGHYFLSNAPPPPPTTPSPRPNGAILTVCKTIRNVMTSAAEAETAGVFGNGQEIIACRISLHALNHPQPATPLKTDNSTSNSFVHANIKQRRSKTWDMRWNWLRDKVTHEQLRIYWDKGSNNNADYYTKHHPPSHHLEQRPRYVLNAHHLTAPNALSTSKQLMQLLAARVCSNPDRYTAVTSNEHLKANGLGQLQCSPHNLIIY